MIVYYRRNISKSLEYINCEFLESSKIKWKTGYLTLQT